MFTSIHLNSQFVAFFLLSWFLFCTKTTKALAPRINPTSTAIAPEGPRGFIGLALSLLGLGRLLPPFTPPVLLLQHRPTPHILVFLVVPLATANPEPPSEKLLHSSLHPQWTSQAQPLHEGLFCSLRSYRRCSESVGSRLPPGLKAVLPLPATYIHQVPWNGSYEIKVFYC